MITFDGVDGGGGQTDIRSFSEAQEPLDDLRHSGDRQTVSQTHTQRQSVSHTDSQSHSQTLWLWLLQGWLVSSRGRQSGRASRHSVRLSSVLLGSPLSLGCTLKPLLLCCHGNQWALTPRRRAVWWSAQETTAAAKTRSRKSVA